MASEFGFIGVIDVAVVQRHERHFGYFGCFMVSFRLVEAATQVNGTGELNRN